MACGGGEEVGVAWRRWREVREYCEGRSSTNAYCTHVSCRNCVSNAPGTRDSETKAMMPSMAARPLLISVMRPRALSNGKSR